MAEKLFTWNKGDTETREFITSDGCEVKATIIHGDPRDLPKVLRDLGRVTGRIAYWKGYTAEEVEQLLIAEGRV